MTESIQVHLPFDAPVKVTDALYDAALGTRVSQFPTACGYHLSFQGDRLRGTCGRWTGRICLLARAGQKTHVGGPPPRAGGEGPLMAGYNTDVTGCPHSVNGAESAIPG